MINPRLHEQRDFRGLTPSGILPSAWRGSSCPLGSDYNSEPAFDEAFFDASAHAVFTDPTKVVLTGQFGDLGYVRKLVTLDGLYIRTRYTVKDSGGNTVDGLTVGGGPNLLSGTNPSGGFGTGISYLKNRFETGPRFLIHSGGSVLYASGFLTDNATYEAEASFLLTSISQGTDFDLTITLAVASLGINVSYTITNWLAHSSPTINFWMLGPVSDTPSIVNLETLYMVSPVMSLGNDCRGFG